MKKAGSKTLLVIVLLAGLLLAGAAAVPAASKGAEVIIKPWYEEVTIGPGQAGVIYWGWATCSRGLLQDWLDATSQEFVLSYQGQVIQTITVAPGDQGWGPAAIKDAPELLAACVWPAAHGWQSMWRFDKLKLKQPGDYELHAVITLSEPLIDGADMDGDGQVDWFPAGPYRDQVVVIHVVK